MHPGNIEVPALQLDEPEAMHCFRFTVSITDLAKEIDSAPRMLLGFQKRSVAHLSPVPQLGSRQLDGREEVNGVCSRHACRSFYVAHRCGDRSGVVVEAMPVMDSRGLQM
jgi:hypothetical protein